MYTYHFLPFLATQGTRPFYRTSDHIMSLLRPRALVYILILSPGPAFYIDFFFILQRSYASCTLCLYQLSLQPAFQG